jgi:plastocyanin
MDRLRCLLAAFLAILALTTGTALIRDVEAATIRIVVNPAVKAFNPQHVSAKLGDEVTWVNEDQEDHFLTSAGPSSGRTVIGAENLLIHKLLHPATSYSHRFSEPGTYNYFCAIHMQMWGSVSVEQ